MSIRITLLLFAALCIAVPALADDSVRAPRILVTPLHPKPGDALRVKVFGDWPNRCQPTLRTARVDGRDIVLQATLGSEGCSGKSQGFLLSTETLAQPPKLGAAGIYRLRFELERTAGTTAELHAFRLLAVGGDDLELRPETGFWWAERGGEFDDAGPGFGVNMEVQSDTLSLSVFGFADDGAPDWQIGAGPIDGRIARIELSRLRDGRGPFQRYRAAREVLNAGVAHLELLSPGRATVWFVRARDDGRGLEMQPVSMVRFRFAMEPAEAWLGRWLIAAEQGDGFPARSIDFVRAEPTERGFALSDASGDLRLRCIAVSERPNSPPESCRLASAAGTLPEVEFDRVGLRELRGRSGSAHRVAALKLSR